MYGSVKPTSAEAERRHAAAHDVGAGDRRGRVRRQRHRRRHHRHHPEVEDEQVRRERHHPQLAEHRPDERRQQQVGDRRRQPHAQHERREHDHNEAPGTGSVSASGRMAAGKRVPTPDIVTTPMTMPTQAAAR
jgi:hypothetical protein